MVKSGLIQLEKLTKIYTNQNIVTKAIDGIDLKINKGDFLAIMGPSGCGKTTLLNIIGMLDTPTSGSYIFEDKEVSGLNENIRAKVRKGKIGFIFQGFNLIDELNIYENIELPLQYLKITKAERKDRVFDMLNKLQLYHKRTFFPQQLSGGQQQKAAIARALITQPSLILADEPTGNLDSANGEEIMKTLSDLNDAGTTLVMVTHSPYDANYAHEIINLFDGRIVQEKNSQQFHI